MKAIKILIALCVVLVLNSFSTLKVLGQETIKSTVKKSDVSEQNKNDQPGSVRNYRIIPAENTERDESDSQTLQNNKANDKYRIGFQDTLEISVFRHPELSLVANVGPDGTILMPRIDQPIVASCKTERELKTYIETLYKSYLRNPFVNVRVSEQRSQSFAVIGAVQKANLFYLNRRTRLLELLALAGGHDVERNPAIIKIARIGNSSGCQNDDNNSNEDEKVEFITYKLRDVLEGKQNPWMQPGDIVSVLEAEEAYVVGQVIKPTKILLKEPKTLTQAIAEAGGFEQNAKTDKVVIQRQESGSGAKTELVYSLKDINTKKIPDPVLQANDIVQVSTDKVKSVRNGLLKALGGGVGNIFYRFP
jgi:polysaccharide export outer membrane protein